MHENTIQLALARLVHTGGPCGERGEKNERISLFFNQDVTM